MAGARIPFGLSASMMALFLKILEEFLLNKIPSKLHLLDDISFYPHPPEVARQNAFKPTNPVFVPPGTEAAVLFLKICNIA